MKRLGSILAALAIGCGGGGGAGDGGDGGDGPGPEPDARGPDSGVAPQGPGLAGVLRDGAGEVLANEQVLACMSTVCLYGNSGVDGAFSFPIEQPAAVALKTLENLDLAPRRGAALCPVAISSDELVEVGSVYCPLLPEGDLFRLASEDPQTLEPGDGLELTLRRADLTPRVGDVLVDAAARLVPPSQVCSLLAIPGEEIIAVYALHPFGAISSSPIAVRAPTDLPPDTAVYFRSVSEIDGRLSEPATGRTDGTTAVTDPGAGITELSWLVISR